MSDCAGAYYEGPDFASVNNGSVERLLAEVTRLQTQLAAARRHHWQTSAVHPQTGIRVYVCGCCEYGDGVPFVWPCPTVAALTGVEPGNSGPDAYRAGG